MIRKIKTLLSLLLTVTITIPLTSVCNAEFHTATYHQYSILEYTDEHIEHLKESLWNIYTSLPSFYNSSKPYPTYTYLEASSLISQKLKDYCIGSSKIQNGFKIISEVEILTTGILQEIYWFADQNFEKKHLGEIKYAIYMFIEDINNKTTSSCNGNYVALWYSSESFPSTTYLTGQDERSKFTTREISEHFDDAVESLI